jgi:hypothetical protein
MIGTLFSIFIALLLVFHPFWEDLNITGSVLGIVMIAVAIPFLFLIPFGFMLSWNPLLLAEQHSTPRIMEMFRKDMHVRLVNAWLIIFCLATFALAFAALYHPSINKTWLFAIWIVLLGITIDSSRHFARRVLGYLNPFAVVKMFTKKGQEAIQDEREMDLCQWIDGLFEIAFKGIQRHSTSIANIALGEQQDLSRLFLESSKSIGHREQDKQTQEYGITDKVTYTMFYLYQRLDMTFEKALQDKLEPTCSYIVTLLGKIALDAAKLDISLASPPLRFLGKLAKRAQDEGLEETAIKASCILVEVAKSILKDIDIKYLEIKDPYLSIINGLENLAKGTFRRDKMTNISLLMQPFKDLKELFQSQKTADHPDTPVIMQNIDRVLGEFEALQVVMSTIPPIPGIASEEPPMVQKEEPPVTPLSAPNPPV